MPEFTLSREALKEYFASKEGEWGKLNCYLAFIEAIRAGHTFIKGNRVGVA
jgi:hypothetical protein